MEYRKNKGANAVLGLFLAFAFCVASVFALAAGNIFAGAEEASSILLTGVSGERAVEGVSWRVYRVGSRTGADSFALDGDFAKCPVDLNGLVNSSDAQDAANTLAAYVKTEGFAPAGTQLSDEAGKAVFGGLEKGIYLIIGDKVTIGEYIYTPVPVLIETAEGENAVEAKFSVKEVTHEEPKKMSYKVSKVWKNEIESTVRPQEIKVGLYKDAELVDTVTLNESNNWTYEWESLENEEWLAMELEVPKSYSVTYRTDGAEFWVINSYKEAQNSDDSSKPDTSMSDTSDSVPDDPESSTPEKVPQTGLLWWPVPVLAAAGIVFIAVGAKVKKK